MGSSDASAARMPKQAPSLTGIRGVAALVVVIYR